jgi:hypothetical protein
MEVKKGKYTFFITNNIETWNGVITGINYKIGGNIRDCVNILVQFDNNIAVSASIPEYFTSVPYSGSTTSLLRNSATLRPLETFATAPCATLHPLHAAYDEECSLYEPLGRGEGSIIMIKTLLMHIKSLHPELKKIRFDDMSSIECATSGRNVTPSTTSAEFSRSPAPTLHRGSQRARSSQMPLYYLSIAYNGESWYEKYFGAVQEDTTKQNAYRVRVNKMLNNITEKPTEYIDFLKITKVPMNIRVELEHFYANSKTYSEFFHLIPKQDRCRLLRPWIKEFMNYYLKGVFSNFDWEIQLSNIICESLSKTRKKQNKSEKKYYCPNGFNRNMNYLKDIGANVL